jgi:hypothetical protein
MHSTVLSLRSILLVAYPTTQLHVLYMNIVIFAVSEIYIQVDIEKFIHKHIVMKVAVNQLVT